MRLGLGHMKVFGAGVESSNSGRSLRRGLFCVFEEIERNNARRRERNKIRRKRERESTEERNEKQNRNKRCHRTVAMWIDWTGVGEPDRLLLFSFLIFCFFSSLLHSFLLHCLFFHRATISCCFATSSV